MLERFLHHVGVELPAPDETVASARVRLADKFPRTALRRMTHLGLLLGATLDGAPFGPEDALVYATTYAETRALEEFLASFPAASPLLFQTSIHPGGVQQVLIGRQQPIARIWPLAGRTRLVEQALLTALLEPAPRVAIVGGEERGTWMLAHHMAAERSFAFAVILTREASGAVGRVEFTPATGSTGLRPVLDQGHGQDAGAPADAPSPSLEDFAHALSGRQPRSWNSGSGQWRLAWQ